MADFKNKSPQDETPEEALSTQGAQHEAQQGAEPEAESTLPDDLPPGVGETVETVALEPAEPQDGAEPESQPEAEGPAPDAQEPAERAEPEVTEPEVPDDERMPEEAQEAPRAGEIADAEVIEERPASEDTPEDAPAENACAENAPADAPEALADTTEPEQPAEAEKPAAKPAPAAPERAAQSSGPGMGTLLVGGVLAAAIGYGAAQFIKPEGWPFPGAGGVSPAALEALSARIDAVEATVDAAGSAPAAPAIDPAVLEALAARIDALEARPVLGDGGAAAEIAALREELEAQRAEKEALTARVNEVAESAQAEIGAALERAADVGARAALMQIEGALDTGAPYEAALADLGARDVPEGLAASAGSGVPTLAALQRDFPEAARAALSAVLKTQTEGAPGDRLSAFLRSQLGLRSLAPRAGDDADAVLSRAEAALAEGNVAGALSELEALPEAGLAEMEAWQEGARARAEAIEAADALARSLNSN